MQSLHVPSQEFLSGVGGWGWGGGQDGRPENSLDNVVLFLFLFLGLNSLYSLQRGSKVLLQRKLYFSKDPGGFNFLQGWGSKCYVHRNPYNF